MVNYFLHSPSRTALSNRLLGSALLVQRQLPDGYPLNYPSGYTGNKLPGYGLTAAPTMSLSSDKRSTDKMAHRQGEFFKEEGRWWNFS